jgi:hypothetical protein
MINGHTVNWAPLANYSGAHHVLYAGACFVHPGNGNHYFQDCVQISGAQQNLNIYRLVAQSGVFEKLVTFEGTIDAEAGFERGACFIGQGGALIVATTMTPKNVPHVTETGFQGVRCLIPGVDAPWSMADVSALSTRVTQLEQCVSALEGQPGGGLSPDQAADLAWVRALRAVLHTA